MKQMLSRLLSVLLASGMLIIQISASASQTETFPGSVPGNEIPAAALELPSNASDEAKSADDVPGKSLLLDTQFPESDLDLEKRLGDFFESDEIDALSDVFPADDGENYEESGTLDNWELTEGLPLTIAEDENPPLPSGEKPILMDGPRSGTLSNGLEWNVTDDTLTVSGKGKMPNFVPDTSNFAPWSSLAFSSVVIEDGVENIGDYAFYDMADIRSVKIGSGVKEIGVYAFLYCEALKSVVIPDSVTVLKRGAFFQCSSLEDVAFSRNLTLIYEGAFQNCANLKSVIFPNGLQGIGTAAFSLCSSLESVTLPNGIEVVGENTFQGCATLRTVTAEGPAGNAEGMIGNKAFAGCSALESVRIPSSVVALGTSAFHGCEKLASVELPPNLRTMGSGAFYECALSKAEIPETVTELGSHVFAYCSQLEEARLPGNVTTLPPYFFAECGKLKAVELPENLKVISEHAFWNCVSLERVPLPENLASIGEKAFEGCKSLQEIIIPDSVTEIGDRAFTYCSSAVALKLPSGLREVKLGAFYGVQGADTLEIPAQVSSIGELAFAGNRASEIVFPDGLKSIGKHAFAGNPNLTSVTLPDSVEEVGEGAFRNCQSLRRAALSCSIKVVPEYCFYLDAKLEEVILPDGIEEIESIAFGDCKRLREITLPNSLKKLLLAPFGYCVSLTHIEIPSSVEFLGSAVFYHCESLREVYLPDSITTLGGITFLGCTSLERVVLPSGIDTLEFWMFADCSHLTDVAIPASVKNIGEAAFQGCKSLTNVYYGGSWANWKTLKTEEAGNEPLLKAEKHYRIERGKPVTLYNLGRLDVSVGSGDNLTDAYFDANGDYAIPLEDNPLFPVRIQFSYERDRASLVSETVWFYDKTDVAEINGHSFSLRFNGSPRFVGVRFLGETVYAIPEQTPFINDMDNQRPEETAERQELFLHLEDRLWGELRDAELILPDGSSAQWRNNSNVDLNHRFDLAKLGLGNHGDLAMDLDITGASEFLCRVHALFLPPEDLLAFRMEDTDGEIQINSLSFTLQEDEPALLKSDAYTLMVDRTPNVGGTVKLGLGFHDGQMEGISVTAYQGAYAGEQEAVNGKDISAQLWGSVDYSLPVAASYESAPEITLVFRRGDKVAQVMPVSIVLVADLISLTSSSYLYAGNDVWREFAGGFLHSKALAGQNGTELILTYGIYESEVPTTNLYYVNLSAYAWVSVPGQENPNEGKGLPNVKKAVLGRFPNPQEFEGQEDISAQLFSESSHSGGGYLADFTHGSITFTILDALGNYRFLTLSALDAKEAGTAMVLPYAPVPLNPDTYFQIGPLEVKDSEVIWDSFVADNTKDSYYYNGYQTVFQMGVLTREENPLLPENPEETELLNAQPDTPRLLNTPSETPKFVTEFVPIAEGSVTYPTFQAGEKITMFASKDAISGQRQISGKTPVTFHAGQPIQYSAAVADGVHMKNYWVTYLTPKAGGASLFVNAASNADPMHLDPETGLPIREIFLDSRYASDGEISHKLLIANLGDQSLTGLTYTLAENPDGSGTAQNIQLGANLPVTLPAYNPKGNQAWDWSNVAVISLLPEKEDDGSIRSGDISGYLIIHSDNGGTITVKLTGVASVPEIRTTQLLRGVRYVPYSSLIQTSSMYVTNQVAFSLTEDSSLPEGVKLYPNGELYGVPCSAGQWEITVQATFYSQKDMFSERQYVLTVLENTDENVDGATDEQYALLDAVDRVVTEYKDQVFRSEGPYVQFVDFWIDGKKLKDGEDYISSDGSTVVTIRAQTLRKQSDGTHTIASEFRTGGGALFRTNGVGDTSSILKRTAQNFNLNAAGGSGGGSGGGGSGGGSGGSSSSGSGSSGGGGSGSKGNSVRKYNITVNSVSNGTLTVNPSAGAKGEKVTITAKPNSGYRVRSVKANGDEVSGNDNKYTFTMPAKNVTVSATFSPIDYAVTTASVSNGTLQTSVKSAKKGDTVSVTATPNKGYEIKSVSASANGNAISLNGSGGRYTFAMPSGNVTARAEFAVKRLAAFRDIQGPDWFFDDAVWAYSYKNGILRGYSETEWRPSTSIHSVSVAVTLRRMDGADLTPYYTGADDGLDNGAWYVAAARWANVNGIFQPDVPFNGYAPMTRGEYAVILRNYLRYRGINVIPTEPVSFLDAEQMTADELDAFRVLREAGVFQGDSTGAMLPKSSLKRSHLAALLHRLSEYIIKTESAGEGT